MATPLRVLIVEDSEDDVLLLERELRRGGLTPDVMHVDSPNALIRALACQHWNLIITDHNMPGFDSNEVLTLVHNSQLDIPIIIVSGSIGEDVAVSAMKAGAHDYIMKDNLARLIPAIERELREAETRRARGQAEEKLRHLAYHDSLTNLVNRNTFEERLKNALSSAKERDLHHALLYLDLDQFKIINDTCGHVAGDELLRQLAMVLQKPIRDRDTLARLGGDEFGVLLEGCPLSQAEVISKRFLKEINDLRFSWQDSIFSIGVSIGVVSITKQSGGLGDILSAADMACYAAKDLGRNRIHVYSETDADVARKHGEMQWVSHINQALEDNRFFLYQQSIIPLGSNGVGANHCEFLLRLRKKNGDMVTPGAFIPAAERFGLMTTLDRWTVKTAFAHVAELHKGNGDRRRLGTFFINLSGTSLGDDGLLSFISEQLAEHALTPECICFEITETAAITNLKKAIEFINGVKDHGCRFALDDFGSGLSSFSYLKTIPVDFLKIDGSFIKDMIDDHMDRVIVEAINNIGHVAGLHTIAEFVETEEILDKLRSIGVDYAQGYGIDAPHPLSVE